MNKTLSIYLDALRFLATITVLISHWAYPRFTDGNYIWIRELNLGSDAVIFFFVLSGLVIGYTAHTKDKTLKSYAWHRATRLYSVMIIAVIVTLIFDTIGQSIAPQNYEIPWYYSPPIWQQFLYGLTFSNEFSAQGFRIGTNGPLWSLSYEAAYYILFGAAFYVRGILRIITLTLISFIVGLNILLLFPAWAVGFCVYKTIKKPHPHPAPVIALAAFIAPIILYTCCLATNVPDYLILLSIKTFGIEAIQSLRFSNEFIWNTIICAFVALHLLGAHGLSSHIKISSTGKIQKTIKWCAGASFTLYVIHYPTLHLLTSILPEDMPYNHAALLVLTLVICFLIAEISERRLTFFREKLKALYRIGRT